MYNYKEIPARHKSGQPAVVAQKKNSSSLLLTDNRPSSIIQRKEMLVQFKNGKGKKKKAADKVSGAQRSLNNIMAYRGGWCKKNDIDLAKMQAFIKTYPSGIRGHASADSSKKEQGNTTTDCDAYKSWHRGIYGWK